MQWQNSRVVVTGGGGFLGRHLCEALLAKGALVTVIDDFSFSTADGSMSDSKKFEIIHHRLGDPNYVLAPNLEWDMLFHLAAVADPRKCRDDFDLAFQANVVGTKDVLANWSGDGRIIFLSTASVYGEPEYLPIDENHPLNGDDPYAVTKLLGEQICKHYRENSNVPITVVRNFNTFGPGQSRSYLIPTLIYQALTDNAIELWNPNPVRDFAYIDNTIDALLSVAETENCEGMTVNIGGGEGIKIGELADRIGDMFGVPVVDLKRDVTGSGNLVCDNSKLRKVTGWEPRITIDEGLELTINYWRELVGEGGILR